ncbi:hypothetical protein [Acidithiobacillus sp.]|uniref:hypothetical protein n=1 Tax=Acidithiobacillus sp. TaxID=1872118 RepID=UPI0032AF51D5
MEAESRSRYYTIAGLELKGAASLWLYAEFGAGDATAFVAFFDSGRAAIDVFHRAGP